MSQGALTMRAFAARALQDILMHGQSLAGIDFTQLPEQQRASAQACCYGVLRHLGELQALAKRYLKKAIKPKDAVVQQLLLIGLFQLQYSDQPAFAIVNETVNATDALNKPWARGLINAILRQHIRAQKQATHDTVKAVDAARINHPNWMVQQLADDWPTQHLDILEANLVHPPLWLRIHTPQTSRADFLTALRDAKLDFTEHAHLTEALYLHQACDVTQLPGYEAGWFAVQDASAQWAPHLLDLQPEQTVLDACSAPGGKSCHLLAVEPTLQLTCLDVDKARLKQVKQNLTRLKLNAQVVCGDALTPENWAPKAGFDRILLDAPCSATGIIRRHPDIKWLRSANDLAQLAQQQLAILKSLWPRLKPGGRLLYVTCSIFKIENTAVIEQFLSMQNDAKAIDLTIPGAVAAGPGQHILSGTQNMDGFYYAALQKSP